MLDAHVVAHDLRGGDAAYAEALLSGDYAHSQSLAVGLRADGSDGIVYPSGRHFGGDCVALFYPDLASNPAHGRHLDYHWNGTRVDFYREVGRGDVYRIDEDAV